MIWLAIFVIVILALAYTRASLRAATITLGATLVLFGVLGDSWGAFFTLLLAYAAVFVPLNMPGVRQEWITRRMLQALRGELPALSDTEQAALEAGTVWWDGELFSGRPDWKRLLSLRAPKLTPEEQAFLDGPVEQFCAMLDGWNITHRDYDLPPEAWDFIKHQRFWGMIIPKEYGGLEFSAYAHSCVLARIAGSSGGMTASSIVSVPNSLGPAELLLNYGTDEQKKHYLPRLATGEEIPCFALTSPWAGSDAAAIPDKGVVCRGVWKGKETLGMRLTFDKRYITLAPVATVIGLAFRLFDPEKLLGGPEDVGITCALLPRSTPGLETGPRHLPLNIPFLNGPVRGRDVFVPLDVIIGGPSRAGTGWRMLMECLAAGRAISLPSSSSGGAAATAVNTGAYARIRRQFGMPIGDFEGVQDALGRIGAAAWAAESVRRLTAQAVDLGEKPAVPSAIAKLYCTQAAQDVATRAMDVLGGKGIMLGPRNWHARSFQGSPIAITVEGANLLTRNLIVFGQGLIRCHPHVRDEIAALQDPSAARALERFDHAVWRHAGHVLCAAARSLVLGLTFAHAAASPVAGATRRHYQRIARYSANLALAADAAMMLLGARLKLRENISARLGDVVSLLYVTSAVLKRFEDDGRPPGDLPFVHWICEDAFHTIEQQLDGVFRHLPFTPLAYAVRWLVFPLGRWARPPRDELGRAIAGALQTPGESADRLASPCFGLARPDSFTGQLRATLARVIEDGPLDEKLRQAAKSGLLKELHPFERIGEAAQKGIITAEEARRMTETLRGVEEACRVDEFQPGELVSAPARAAAETGRGPRAHIESGETA